MNHWTPGRPRLHLAVALLLLVLGMLGTLYSSSARAATPGCHTGHAGKYDTVTCFNKTYHCTSRLNHTQVNVTIDSPNDKIDAVHLDTGCTGVGRFRITTNSGDGIKLHEGAHDLQVWFGKPHKGTEPGTKVGILCTGKSGAVHQDGIQAMGGHNVTFMYPSVRCPTGNNGGLFCNNESGHPPTDVVAEYGFLYEGNAAVHIGESVRCGARHVTLRTNLTKASPANCIRIEKGAAQEPVDEDNHCLTRR